MTFRPVFVLAAAALSLSAQTLITTVAGSGNTGFFGDGGPATAANLNSPTSVAVDPSGNIYIADLANHRVRRVANGVITTVAGTGTPGFSGDGGLAVNAQLDTPKGVAVDIFGNLYISDSNNNRVRRVAANGVITTYAGSGATGLNGGGFAGDAGAATSALLAQPFGVACDTQGSLYIADSSNARIRKVSTGGQISTFAGSGVDARTGDGGQATLAGLGQTYGVATDSAGNVYISTYRSVRKVAPSGIIQTIAGGDQAGYSGDGGQAINAKVNFVFGVAADSAGNIYLADFFNARIRQIDAGGIIRTVAGTGVAGFNGDNQSAAAAQINFPWGVATDSLGAFYIADGPRIRKVTGASNSAQPAVVAVTTVTAGETAPTLRFVFSDPSGASALSVVNVLIHFGLDGINSCYLAYNVQNDTLYLVGDNGLALSGMTLSTAPANTRLDNTQCGIPRTGVIAEKSGNTLTLTVPFEFKQPFAGSLNGGKVIHMAARNINGGTSGWRWMGAHITATPNSNPMPVALSQTSNIFTLAFRDATDARNLQPMQILVSNGLDGRGACYIGFHQTTNKLYLVNDEGGNTLPNPIALNGAAGPAVVENSQCRITAAGSTYIVSGANLILQLIIDFKPAFSGRTVYAAAQTLTAANSGWRIIGFAK